MLTTQSEGNQTPTTNASSIRVSWSLLGGMVDTSGPSRDGLSTGVSELSDDELIVRADDVARAEHDTSLSLIDLLLEMDRRSIYLSLGYSSLFDFCARRWLFSRAKAGRYIAVARGTLKFPELRSVLNERRLTIGNAAQIVGILSCENASAILGRVSGCTYREIEEIAAEYRDAKSVREVLRPIGVGGGKKTRPSEQAVLGTLSGQLSKVLEASDTLGGSGAAGTLCTPTESCINGTGALTVSGMSSEGSGESPDLSGNRNQSPGAVECGGSDTERVAGSLRATCSSSSELRGGLASGTPSVQLGADTNPTRAAQNGRAESTGRRAADCCGATDASASSSDSQPETRYEVRFSLGRSAVQKLRRVQAIRSNNTTLEELMELLLDDYLERHDPKRRSERRDQRKVQRRQKQEQTGSDDCGVVVPERAEADGPERSENAEADSPERREGSEADDPRPSEGSQDHRVRSRPSQDHHSRRRRSRPQGPQGRGSQSRRSRHVPANVRDLVFERDSGRCAFVGPEGRRCDSTRHLQVDHVIPFCRGGTHEPDNLRLLCGRHNRSEAKRLLGEVGGPRQRSLGAETPSPELFADP